MRRLMWAAIPALLFIVGCGADESLHQLPIAATGTSISQAKSIVASAETANQAIKPHADAAGQALVGVVSKDHSDAQAMLDKANAANQAAAKQLAAAQKAQADAAAALVKVKSGWGYRLQIAVGFVLTLLAILEGLHLLLLAAGLFLTGSIGVILTMIGHIINPLGWGEAIVAHFKLNKCSNGTVSVEVVPAGGSSPAPSPSLASGVISEAKGLAGDVAAEVKKVL